MDAPQRLGIGQSSGEADVRPGRRVQAVCRDEPLRRAQLATAADDLDVGGGPGEGQSLEEGHQALLGAHPAEPHQSRSPAGSRRRLGAHGIEEVVVDAVPHDVDALAACRRDAVCLEAAREVRRGRRHGRRALGESAEVGPAVGAARARADRAPLPTAEEPQHGARRGGGRGDADIHAVVHGVHDGTIVAGGVAVSEEGSPEIGLHVHDVDGRARGQRVIHPAVGATAGPGQRVLAIERYRDRRHVDVGVVGGDRRRPASVEGGGDDRDGVPGSLEEFALQAHRDLRATERFDVLIAEHHHVHGVTPGAVRRGRGLRRCRGCG